MSQIWGRLKEDFIYSPENTLHILAQDGQGDVETGVYKEWSASTALFLPQQLPNQFKEE